LENIFLKFNQESNWVDTALIGLAIQAGGHKALYTPLDKELNWSGNKQRSDYLSSVLEDF